MGGDTTIGGLSDRRGLPTWIIDDYTGAELSWAFNSPILHVRGVVLTIGRSLCSTLALVLVAAVTRSALWMGFAAGWVVLQAVLIRLLRVASWSPLAWSLLPWWPPMRNTYKLRSLLLAGAVAIVAMLAAGGDL